MNKFFNQAQAFIASKMDNDSTSESSTSESELHRAMKTMVQSALQKMDVVSREEFDAQTAVLQRTRAKLEALEKEIDELNQQLDEKN